MTTTLGLLFSWLHNRPLRIMQAYIFGHNSTKIYSRSVDPRKLRVGVKYYVVYTFLHTSKSHSAAPGMHSYSARELRAKMHVVSSALQLFTLHFLS